MVNTAILFTFQKFLGAQHPDIRKGKFRSLDILDVVGDDVMRIACYSKFDQKVVILVR